MKGPREITPISLRGTHPRDGSEGWPEGNYTKLGDELQLKISKAGNASRFEKNSPPEVLRVIEGANHH